jgi:hypothetical protein
MFAKGRFRAGLAGGVGICRGTETALEGLVERCRMPGPVCREELPGHALGNTQRPNLPWWLWLGL